MHALFFSGLLPVSLREAEYAKGRSDSSLLGTTFCGPHFLVYSFAGRFFPSPTCPKVTLKG